jgi:hypothetical protein
MQKRGKVASKLLKNDPFRHCKAGLPDFSRYNIPKRGKICVIAKKYTKLPEKYTKWP